MEGLRQALQSPFVLLENRLDRSAPARLYIRPRAIVRCDRPEEVPGAYERLQAAIDGEGLQAAGFMAYELGYLLEPRLAPLLPADRSGPLLWFGLFEAPTEIAPDDLDAVLGGLAPPLPIENLEPGHDRARHVALARRVLDLIRAGDVYQVNLTFPMRFRYGGDPLALYAALRVQQPAAHGGMVALEDGAAVLSVSPELFVAARSGQVVSRPMKGTAPRGCDAADDAARAAALQASPKDRAENLMIVDLIRNDLSRIAHPGSVKTKALFEVETYPTLHTLTSTIRGRVRPDVMLRELAGALFPCGSVVGAPKIRAVEVIRELEATPRGVYAGAIGFAAPGGELAFNVAIRTAQLDGKGRGTYGVGGGVVADSDPDAEYDEALLKARVLTPLAKDFSLIETFRWSAAGGFIRLGDHLARMGASAAELGFAFDRADVEARLAGLGEAARGGMSDLRVRLQLSRDGDLQISEERLSPSPAAEVKLMVADEVLDAADPFLRHKTSRRDVHEAAFAAAAARGFGEAVIPNRQGRVADGARSTLVAEVGGRLVTPRVADGALPGVLRARLLAMGAVAEGPLTLVDLSRAPRLYVVSSLHGLRPAAQVARQSARQEARGWTDEAGKPHVRQGVHRGEAHEGGALT